MNVKRTYSRICQIKSSLARNARSRRAVATVFGGTVQNASCVTIRKSVTGFALTAKIRVKQITVCDGAVHAFSGCYV